MPADLSAVHALGPKGRTNEGKPGRIVYIDPGDAKDIYVGDADTSELANPTWAPILGFTEDGWPVVDHK